MLVESTLTRSLLRYSTLIAALRDGPLRLPDLLAQLVNAYPQTPSARRMLNRDIEQLRTLGIVIERDTTTRPPIYTLRGGTPVFSQDELRALALIRDTFSDQHPQAAQVRALLARLTEGLTGRERQIYNRRQALRAPVEPAIDYTPYAPLIAQLEEAISKRQMVAFAYCPLGRAQPTQHRRVEPYEIAFYERHFYLVAYTSNSRQVLDFRIDRIQRESFTLLERLPPGMEHARTPITFRYRLAAALAQGTISRRFESQRVVERLPNGDVIIEAEGRSDFFIIQTLLRYRANAELLEPAWLRAKLLQELRSLAALYQL
jgi:predicted DNA-binding transcriptional regulator YafY